MSSDKRTVLLAVILALTVAMAGCAGAFQDTSADEEENDKEGQMDGDALQGEAIQAMEEVETVSFELEQTTETFGMQQTTSTNGTIDLDSGEAELSVELGDSGLGMLLPESMEAYLADGTAYLNLNDEWVKTDVENSSTKNASLWSQDQDQVTQQKELLENGSLEIQDTTTFDGHEVYVVDVDIDDEQVKEMYGQKDNGQFDTAEAETDMNVSEISVTQYIDTESYYVRYTDVNVTVDSAFGSTSTRLTMTLDDFNEPTDIELPAEAEGATDLSEWLAGEGFGQWGEFGNESDWSWGDEESDDGLFGNESDWSWGGEESDGGLFGNDSGFEIDFEFGNESSWNWSAGQGGFEWGNLSENWEGGFEFGNHTGDSIGNETWEDLWEDIQEDEDEDSEAEEDEGEEDEDEAEAESA